MYTMVRFMQYSRLNTKLHTRGILLVPIITVRWRGEWRDGWMDDRYIHTYIHTYVHTYMVNKYSKLAFQLTVLNPYEYCLI